MAPYTSEERNYFKQLLTNFVSQRMSRGTYLNRQLQMVMNKKDYLEAKKNYLTITKLLPIVLSNESYYDQTIDFLAISKGFFMTTLIFASMIRLKLPIVNREKGELYTTVPSRTYYVLNRDSGFSLLFEILKEHSKTWSHMTFITIFKHIITKVRTINVSLIYFIEQLLDLGIIRYENFNRKIEQYFTSTDISRRYWDDDLIDDFYFGTDPKSPENESKNWIKKIEKLFNKSDESKFAIILMEYILKHFDNEQTVNIILKFYMNIILNNQNLIVPEDGSDDLILYVIKKTFGIMLLNKPEGRPNGKSVLNLFLLAMMEVERYILTTLPPETSFGLMDQMRMYNSSRLKRNRRFRM